MAGLRQAGRGFPVMNARVPIVPAAIIFDLINGGDKDWPTQIHGSPYPALGQTALNAVEADFALGSTGAGTGALTATTKGGLGSASFVLPNGITVGALMIANPIGSVTVPGTCHFWAAPFEQGDEFGARGPDPRSALGTELAMDRFAAMTAYANTTIGIVATDADLSKAQCQRVAVASHDGIARACVPCHSPMDGDLIFAASTGVKSLPDPDRDLMMIGHAASLCVARAIARAIYEATPADDDILPCWRDL